MHRPGPVDDCPACNARTWHWMHCDDGSICHAAEPIVTHPHDPGLAYCCHVHADRYVVSTAWMRRTGLDLTAYVKQE